ncbi:MAG TPA: hypothetical protein VFG22_02140 [Polyangiales bacterium]|jgi:hypothetical protein|nr:hypothetical protein [Polyangiales bacterium]
MTRHALPFFLFVLAISGGVGASAARAQDGLSGSWKLASSNAEAAERRAAIEAATQELPYFTRSRGRERLEERTTPLAKVRISVVGDRVDLTGSGPTISLTVGGPSVPVEAEGRRGSARATRQEGNLVITLQGENGVRTTIYRLSEDGQRLVLDVDLAAKAISTPVRYRVTYERS